MRWRAVLGGLLLLALAAAPIDAAGGAWWFNDGYTDTAWVDGLATSATVDTTGAGTVRLPYLPMQLALDPTGTYALVALPVGVPAYVYDGRGVRPVADWALGTLPAVGAAWIEGGRAFAVATASALVVYARGRDGRAVRAADVAVRGALGLAPGPRLLASAVLAATATGAVLYQAAGTTLEPLPGGPAGLSGNRGVAATADGALVATWQADGAQIWAWDGAVYLPAPTWNPPPPPAPAGPIVGLAFFPGGHGYWLLTGTGQLLAYSLGLAGPAAIPGMSLSLPARADPPAGIAAGWAAGSVAVLYPDGWAYADMGPGGVFGPDRARSLATVPWPVYPPSAVLVSTDLRAPHDVGEVRVEDAACAAGALPPDCRDGPVVPSGTGVAYEVSTDGGRQWTPVPPYRNTVVPVGVALRYRLTLTTTNPRTTPVVGATNIYEIARRASPAPAAALLCAGAGC